MRCISSFLDGASSKSDADTETAVSCGGVLVRAELGVDADATIMFGGGKSARRKFADAGRLIDRVISVECVLGRGGGGNVLKGTEMMASSSRQSVLTN